MKDMKHFNTVLHCDENPILQNYYYLLILFYFTKLKTFYWNFNEAHTMTQMFNNLWQKQTTIIKAISSGGWKKKAAGV